MAFETGAATDLDDLFTKLLTFAVANGWTQDASVSGDEPALHKNGIYIQFRYNGTSPGGSGRSVGLYQSTGYTGGLKPGAHPNDSGSGRFDAGASTDSNIALERCALHLIGEGPFTYWFFENDASPCYLHCVVKKGSDQYRHFGFGELEKVGNWGAGATGGEYCYGQRRESTQGFWGNIHQYGMDAAYTTMTTLAECKKQSTMRATGLPGQGGTEKWVSFCNNPAQWAASINDDRASIQRRIVVGGARGGPYARALSSAAIPGSRAWCP